MAVLVTGGTGYIGSVTCVQLLKSGRDIVIVDNYYNSKPQALKTIGEIVKKRPVFYDADVCDGQLLDEIFTRHEITEVIHFAGYKAVVESVAKPLEYYRNNVGGTCTLLEAMSRHNVKKLVFSSSACVYGMHDDIPDTEESPLYSINPYGRTKLIIEKICSDIAASDKDWEISLLRYYNPIGAYIGEEIPAKPKALGLGEDPNGIPNNLMPILMQAAKGIIPHLNVYGKDYPTPDGTCIRDYIHVVDLAEGHIAALENLKPGAAVYNLGTGKGYSVLEIIKAFEKVNNVKVPYVFAERRAGDAPEYYADSSKAARELGWKAQLSLEQMCKDAWEFYK